MSYPQYFNSGLSSFRPTGPHHQLKLNSSMATKIDWDRVQRQSRLGKERYMGFG